MRALGFIVLAGIVVGLGSACGRVTGEGDSETHWLIRCTTSAECGVAAECLCGVCTIRCDAGLGCGEGPSGSHCVAGASAAICGAALAPTGGLCLRECSNSTDCAVGYECSSGACVQSTNSSAPPISNPTGDCVTEANGKRIDVDFDAQELTYLPDCAPPLRREYYRVFARSNTSALVRPRVDGRPELAEACSPGANHPLSDIVSRYPLCQVAANNEELVPVDDMAPADAFAVARYLNGRLAFRGDEHRSASGVSIGIYPFPAAEDIADVCALYPSANSQDLLRACESYRAELASENGYYSLWPIYTGAVTAEIAGRLNQLYGIGPECGEALPLEVCAQCAPEGGCDFVEFQCTTACNESSDCPSERPFCKSVPVQGRGDVGRAPEYTPVGRTCNPTGACG